MGKPVDIEYLPLEILEVIVSFLTNEDLTQCLHVSQTWYSIFSDNTFWRKRCLTNSSDYLSKTKCLVEPSFKEPLTLLPIQKQRHNFLQEQHLWKNWDSGCFKKEEIEFDCDDSISYNIGVSFLDNDHICLHRTFETEVWNIAETPFSVMIIPHCLKEMWETNIYKVIEDNLVVIQCNVVQVYKINLNSKSWCLKHVFFFNESEEFASNITNETDVDDLFNEQSFCDESHLERVICGQYFIGAYNSEISPFLHVWDIRTGKKLTEEKCELCREKFWIHQLTVPSVGTNKILATFKFKKESYPFEEFIDELGNHGTKYCSIIYDASQLKFLLPTRRHHSGLVMYFDGYLSVIYRDHLTIMHHLNELVPIDLQATEYPTAIEPLGKKLLISSKTTAFLFNTTETALENPENLTCIKVDFIISKMKVLCGKYVLLHDLEGYEGVKEIWKIGKSLKKIMEFPDDSGTYVASNCVGSKIVLEKGNKLIILNFW